MATTATCTEVLADQSYETSLRSGDVAIRSFFVNPREELTTYGTPDQARWHPGIPRKGDAHPRVAGLIAQVITSRYREGSVQGSDVRVLYTPTQGSIWPLEKPRRRWSLASRQIEMLVDLDGRTIGSAFFSKVLTKRRDSNGVPIQSGGNDQFDLELEPGGGGIVRKRDPDAQLGKSVLVPEITLSIQMPLIYQFDVGLCASMVTAVNATTFEGQPAGTVQYLGANADQVGINGEYFVTHEFRIGRVTYYDKASTSARTLYLDQDFYNIYFEEEGGRKLEDDANYVIGANRKMGNFAGTINQNPTTVRLYQRADLNLLTAV